LENYAIVIGINEYKDTEYNLKGCVNDALSIKKWLLDPRGGNVPPGNLFLLLGDDDKNIMGNDKPNTNQIQNRIQKIEELSENGGADKLFFYYAGHGFCNRGPGVIENVVMPSDYDDDNKNTTTIEIKSVIDFCAGLNFLEQTFFFDSCRNFPSREYFTVNYYKKKASSRNPNLKQHVFYATSLGSVTNESNLDGVQGGLFTKALVKGLSGKGNAKVYDPTTNQYKVKGERLVKFIKEEVKKSLRQNTEEVVNYNPNLFGNPLLATFERNQFPKVKLEISIKPNEIAQDVKIEIIGGESIQSPQPTPSPFSAELFQSDYGIRATLDGYEPNKKPYGIELYSPQNITLEMTPYPPGNSIPNVEGGEDGTLTISCKDPLVLLELMDTEKTVLKQGRIQIESELKEGLYYAKMKNSDKEHEELIALRAGEKITKTLEFPEISNILEDEGSQFSSMRRSLQIPPLKDFIKDSSMTTVIALASRWKPFENSADDLGLFSSISSIEGTGLHLIVGSNVKERNKEFVKKLKINIWKQGDSKPKNTELNLKQFKNAVGFGELAKNLDPGPYFMSLESENQLSVIFSIIIPYESVAYFILQQDRNGKSRIFQYLPLSNPRDLGLQYDHEISAIRQLEIVQRYYHSDIQNYFYGDALKLAYDKWYDPMAGLISGNLMLRNMGEHEKHSLEMISGNMVNHFNEISDSHVLRGRFLALNNLSGSKESFFNAVNIGVPIFTENLEALYEAIKDYNFEKPTKRFERLIKNSKLIKDVFENRVRNSLWTCYVPKRE